MASSRPALIAALSAKWSSLHVLLLKYLSCVSSDVLWNILPCLEMRNATAVQESSAPLRLAILRVAWNAPLKEISSSVTQARRTGGNGLLGLRSFVVGGVFGEKFNLTYKVVISPNTPAPVDLMSKFGP